MSNTEKIMTEKEAIALVTESGYNLHKVPVELRTKKVCKLAVTKNGFSIKDVPAEFRKDFYLDAVMSGRGLSNIPEEDRTDRICTIAVDKNPQEFRYVPVDKRSYTLSMIAVDKNAENLEFVTDENIDSEMIIRFVIAVLKKNYTSEYALREGKYSENGKTSPLNKAFSHIVKEGMRHTQAMEAKESIMFEVLRREPSVFPEFVKQSSDRGFTQFEKLINMSLCMIAVKGDKKNVASIPHAFHERVWNEYVQNHLK
jgi:hypothetical protein